MVSTKESKQMKKVVFMMGSPAAGKSTIANKMFSGLNLLDSDEIKKTHPNYDPKHPEGVHAWSSLELEKQFQASLKQDEDFVVDGTGSNSDKLVRRITEAKNNGFVTELVYVTCSLETSLSRNAQRERVVPEDIVREIFQDIQYSFEIVSHFSDKTKIINNE